MPGRARRHYARGGASRGRDTTSSGATLRRGQDTARLLLYVSTPGKGDGERDRVSGTVSTDTDRARASTSAENHEELCL
jgi:hypothetical protein